MNKQLVFILLTIMLLLVGCGKTETAKEKLEPAKIIEKPVTSTTSEQKVTETPKTEEKPAVAPTETTSTVETTSPVETTSAVETTSVDELVDGDIVVVEEKAETEQITTILEESETDFGTVI